MVLLAIDRCEEEFQSGLNSLSGLNWNGLREKEQKIRCRPVTDLLSKRIGDAVPDNRKLLKLKSIRMVSALREREKKIRIS
jgi:hypothetical protein